MMHRVRNELLVPFITRLPGTSDAPWVEEERARLIVVETVRRIVAAEYDEVWGKPMLAARCRAVQLFEQVSPAMAKAQAVLPLESETGAQRAPRLSAFRSPRRLPLRRRGSGCGAFLPEEVRPGCRSKNLGDGRPHPRGSHSVWAK